MLMTIDRRLAHRLILSGYCLVWRKRVLHVYCFGAGGLGCGSQKDKICGLFAKSSLSQIFEFNRSLLISIHLNLARGSPQPTNHRLSKRLASRFWRAKVV